MAFQNPILAGEELIRDAIRSENFSDDGEGEGNGWRIGRDGSATFNAVNVRGNSSGPSASYDVVVADQSLIYRGEELGDLLDRRAKGLIAYGQLPPGDYPVAAGAGIKPLVELDVAIEPNRAYRVYSNHVRLTSPVATENPRFLLFYTTDGTQPVPFVGTTALAEIGGHTNVVANRMISQQVMWTAYPGNVTRLRVVLCLDAEFGNAVTTKSDAVKLHVEDAGEISLTNTGIVRWTGVAPPPPNAKTFYTFEFAASDIRSYQGDNDYMRNDYMYQGQSPASTNGNTTSRCWFAGRYNANPGNLLHIAGVSAADVQYLDVYMYFPHWYYGSGGTARLGWHDDGGIPAVGVPKPGAGIFNVQGIGYPGRNIGKWTSILGNGIGNAVLAGNFRGFLLGPGVNGLTDYGYCLPDIAIRAGYYK